MMLDLLTLMLLVGGATALVRLMFPNKTATTVPDDAAAVPGPEPAKKGIDWTMWIVAFVFVFLFTFANMGGR